MNLKTHTPTQALNKAYRKQSVARVDIERFKIALQNAFRHIDEQQDEEYHKNVISRMLTEVYYKNNHIVNVNKRQDLVIRLGSKTDDPVGVILEFKKPSNTPEMIRPDQPNAKALHEVILYYLRETIDRDNHHIKHLIITNIWQWYIFDGVWFEKNIYRNTKLRKAYQEFKASGHDTRYFYEQIAAPFLYDMAEDIPCTFFDLHDYQTIITNANWQDDDKLIDLYKILSPAHLLKQPFANDSNTLNKEFYNELLHIIGLTEAKEGGKKVIRRLPKGHRHDASLLENAINKLQVTNRLTKVKNYESYAESTDEQLFSVGLELCLKWINRILFLKLLEGQLIKYHNGDRSRAFLNQKRITDFDELEELFLEVLAVPVEKRRQSVQEKFVDIPYLNSSLFEIDDLEDAAIRISALKDRLEMPLYAKTVLKDSEGKPQTRAKSTLAYLFEFLDAYDFASDSNATIQEQNKSMINASVLGLIFEKINGYRDGSFFTPGFITMYMCRETLRRAVVQKFNEELSWKCASFSDVQDKVEFADRDARQQANEVINSLKICDPAVGSGHFLVSALNELIAIKSDLKILCDRAGQRIKGYAITIENDELIVTDTEDDTLFEYRLNQNGNPITELQTVQEALFHEKQTLIENCLFGVDINPKSVMICRLRLWIELLKNAYYIPPPLKGTRGMTRNSSFEGGRSNDLQLETLPNIDINIKTGNSLISRFTLTDERQLEAHQRQFIRNLMDDYKLIVAGYKNATDKAQKDNFRNQIERIKSQLEQFVLPNDTDFIDLRKKEAEFNQTDLFDREKQIKLAEDVSVLKKRIADKMKTLYGNAFEWRFEFPEVLDADGNFVGFDVVIGNPPYIRQEELGDTFKNYAKAHYKTYAGTADIFVYFFEKGWQILCDQKHFCMITSNKYLRAGYGKNVRQFLQKNTRIDQLIDFGDAAVFEEAIAYPHIILWQKRFDEANEFDVLNWDTANKNLDGFAEIFRQNRFQVNQSRLTEDGWRLESSQVLNLMDKLRATGTPLGEYVNGRFYRGILTGYNKAFVIDKATKDRLIAEDPKSAEVIKPFLRGKDVKRWRVNFAEQYLIKIESSENKIHPWSGKNDQEAEMIFKQTYPAIYNHFTQYRKQLIKRYDQGKYFWELRSCQYWEEFDKTKIVYPDIAQRAEFSFDTNNHITVNTIYQIGSDEKWLVGLLNSQLLFWYYANLSNQIRGGYVRYFTQYVEQIPIPKNNNPAIEAKVNQILAAKSADPTADTTALEREIDQMVYELYGLTGEEIKIVEGT